MQSTTAWSAGSPKRPTAVNEDRPAFFHIDEAGNTGMSLFDEYQQRLSYGVLSSKLNGTPSGVARTGR